ncbi:septum formation initiator [Polymorphospora lycopeni]|uniref:Septum formation initiator n=1 Tax=Polymorphospora lycopeni TaxID=3140240 RepID=A0ABV5CS51_9ACTN
MRRRTVLAVAGWLAAVAAATLTGVGAVNVIGAGITGGSAGDVYSQERIARDLALPPSAGPTGPAPEPSPSATPTTPAATPEPRHALSTPGGTVVARCVGGEAELTSWTPHQGYGASDVDRGPDDDAEVTFNGPGGSYEVSVTCVDGQPRVTWELDD